MPWSRHALSAFYSSDMMLERQRGLQEDVHAGEAFWQRLSPCLVSRGVASTVGPGRDNPLHWYRFASLYQRKCYRLNVKGQVC